MTDELLPALPEPSLMTHLGNVGFTADQLHAYAREAIRQQWRPISEAPRDGRNMILLLTSSGWPQVAFSNTWWTCGFSVECKPTHWMPLPSPPAGEVS